MAVLKELRPNIKTAVFEIAFAPNKVSVNEVWAKGNLKEAINDTLGWFSGKSKPLSGGSKKPFLKKPTAKKSSAKFAKTLTLASLLIAVLVFFAPMYFLAASGVALILSKNYVVSGDLEKTSKFLTIAKTTADLARRELIQYSEIHLLGRFFEPGVVIAALIERG